MLNQVPKTFKDKYHIYYFLMCILDGEQMLYKRENIKDMEVDKGKARKWARGRMHVRVLFNCHIATSGLSVLDQLVRMSGWVVLS